MPAQPVSSIPQFEISTITEQELQKPPASKMLVKRCMELEAECQQHVIRRDAERRAQEQTTKDLHTADSRCQVLEAKLALLNNRDAISQLLWGATSIIVAILIESLKSGQWFYSFLCAAATALLICAVLLLQGYKRDAPGSRQDR
jgi:hypothetical protein